MGNAKGVPLRSLGENSGRFGDSCGRPEPPRRHAEQALELVGERALDQEADAGGDLSQGQVAAQELLGPLDAALGDVVVRRQPGGRLELPRSGRR